ncbi:MAG: carbohydrate binding family 9 domain-containing protein [Bacteroidia bacterium]|nr:carbohydrate binding family 9 domain-containing protein [Bacteroidia bacterium]
MRQFHCSITLLCFLLAFSTLAQDSSRRTKKRVYTTNPLTSQYKMTIDGILDEAGWNLVEWGTDFIENEPDENTPPSEQTQFKVVYDEKNLYVALRAFDSAPDSIVKRLSRRDGFEGDRINVSIDSYYDERTAFIFTVTAAGVKGDEIATNNGDNIDDSWNPIWYTKANIDGQGWTAEMRIPLSQLRFGNADKQVWGFNVARRFFRKNETSVWNRIPIDAPGFVSEQGELHGLVGIKPQKQLEIQPFTVTQLDTYPEEAGNPFRDGSDFKFNGGVDGKIGVTNDLTLDFTVNPDFGQVDADPAAIALDGFEIFFQERRPFFVENKNIFDYQFADNQDNVFFSRRIGRSPQGFPSTSAGEFVDQPINTTILGAAKFSGKTNNGWSIGVLESLTGKMFAEIYNNGDRREEIVEPLTNYFVGRLQKDFNDRNSYVGGIFTSTNRNLEGNLDFLRKAAYTGGLDFRHNWKDRKYYIEGNLVTSHVTGSEESITNTQNSLTHLFQRVDASHVEVDPTRTSLTGTGGKLEIGKASSGNWRYNGSVVWKSPELELNDIGFLRQADDIRQYFNLSYQTLKPVGTFRQIRARFNQFTAFDFEGNYNRIQYRIGGFAQFNNNWFVDVGYIHKPRIHTNTILQGGPRYRFSQEDINFLFIGSDERKKFRSSFGYVFSAAKQNNFKFFRLEGDVTYQPSNALLISIQPEFTKNPSKVQYVTERDFNGTPRYIQGSFKNESLSASIRVNYTINPNLTVQYYGQPFVFRARFKDFKYVTNPIAKDLNERFQLYDDNQISFDGNNYSVDEDLDGNADYGFGNPDFSFVQFRSNLVVRWEYIPGSELFFVWSQGVTGFGNTDDTLITNLNDQIFKQQPDNTFLIKATYRFVL